MIIVKAKISNRQSGTHLRAASATRLKYFFISLLIFSVSSTLYAQSKVGTTAAAFLEIGAGARGVAMGEAHVASVYDVTSLYWNPAGITSIRGAEATFQYNQWIAGTNLSYAAFALNVPNFAHIGVQLYLFDSGSMDVTDILFEDGTGETFRVQDLMIGLTLARQLTNRFSIGGSGKYIQSTIWRMSSSTFALDLGMQYDTPLKNLKLGFNISNYGGEMQLDGDNIIQRIDLDPNSSGNNDGLLAKLVLRSWDIPLNFRIGLAYKIESGMHALVLSTDAMYPNNNDAYLNAGLEYGFNDMLFIRGGVSQIFLKDAEGQLRGGFGLKVARSVRADYAWSDRGVLGSTSLIGLTIMF